MEKIKINFVGWSKKIRDKVDTAWLYIIAPYIYIKERKKIFK